VRRLIGSALAAALAPLNAYLLGLLAAAARQSPPPVAAGRPPGLRFAVLVPARDEEAGLGATLASLGELDYPADRRELIVIADNCIDRTAEVAAAAGATVWRRHGETHGGKGAALAWGLARIQAERPEHDAVVVVDADCTASRNLLTAVEGRLRAGAEAVQVTYAVANPDASSVAALRYASFALMNLVRPRGKAALGLSAGLFGTGMAFSRTLLARLPWTAQSLVEDQEYHLAIVAEGARVEFAPEAWVRSAMPTSLQRARSQQLRWDAGRAQLLRRYGPRLLRLGLRRRDRAQLHAALEPLVPPQSLLLAGNAAGVALALDVPNGLRRIAFANAAAQIAFVFGGLLLAGVPAAVWRALVLAPGLAVWRLGVLTSLWIGRAPAGWVRTEREPAP
jgi:cellulose synthase/poly-beta-1,6-N-acetylglucosamine synthase-like glycosyltransferase